MHDRRVLRQVDHAAADRRLVRVTRGRRWDRLDGSIVARSAKWLLMATDVDAGFNGHTAIRLVDIRSIESGWSGAAFAERALAAEGHWPLPGIEQVDLTSTRSTVSTLNEAAPPLSIFYEQDRPDACLIGVARDFGPKTFSLQTISPDAQWDDDASVFRYREVSRIDVGGAYERRLVTVGGRPPAWR